MFPISSLIIPNINPLQQQKYSQTVLIIFQTSRKVHSCSAGYASPSFPRHPVPEVRASHPVPKLQITLEVGSLWLLFDSVYKPHPQLNDFETKLSQPPQLLRRMFISYMFENNGKRTKVVHLGCSEQREGSSGSKPDLLIWHVPPHTHTTAECIQHGSWKKKNSLSSIFHLIAPLDCFPSFLFSLLPLKTERTFFTFNRHARGSSTGTWTWHSTWYRNGNGIIFL